MQNNQVRIRVDALCDLQQFQEMFLNNETWSKLIQYSLNLPDHKQKVETPEEVVEESNDKTTSEENTETEPFLEKVKPRTYQKRQKPKTSRANKKVRVKLQRQNVLDVLEQGPLTPADIRQRTGIPATSCHTLVYRLHHSGILKRERHPSGAGYLYSLNKKEESAQETEPAQETTPTEPVQEVAKEESLAQRAGRQLPVLAMRGLCPGTIQTIADYADPPSCLEISRKMAKPTMVIRKVLEDLCKEGYVEELHIKGVPTYDLTEKGLNLL